MKLAIASILLLASLAGCADSGGAEGTQDCSQDPTADGCTGFEKPPEVTETTGNIRGLVMTATYEPVPGVSIRVVGTEINITSSANGTFVIGPLEAGIYLLEASRPGWKDAQSTANVLAGVAEPDITRVLMEADPAAAPYAVTYEDVGVIYCGWGIPITYSYCGDDLGTPDDPHLEYEVSGKPSYIQVEIYWESTQPSSDNLYMIQAICPPDEWNICPGNTPFEGDAPYRWDEGTWKSPAIMRSPEGYMEEAMAYHGLEDMEGWLVGVDVSADGPVLATGVTLDQEFVGYVTIFWNIEPDEEWNYIANGPYPTPE